MSGENFYIVGHKSASVTHQNKVFGLHFESRDSSV